VKPKAIKRFEPWMALSFSEGSIGGDIEKVSVSKLADFYGVSSPKLAALDPIPGAFVEPKGSNGMAIAPSNTVGRHALLLINPHTSFFFRSEQQVTSDQGLNAYGAATWGQFFIYQGFNAKAGWMHTTSGQDSVDEFAETIIRRDGKLFYEYGAGRAAGHHPHHHRALQDRRRRHGGKDLHHLPDPPWPHRRIHRRQVDRHGPDAQAG